VPRRAETAPLRLFEGYGVEIEYALVERDTLAAAPISDRILRDQQGRCVQDLSHGTIAWCNELALHVIELKNELPAGTLVGLDDAFQESVREAERRLAPLGARLMPTAMHPFMDPARETRLWPHANALVYSTFDRIFGCRGHGWSNIQSTQLNLPFGDDAEFARLHAAVRLLLPVLPALAASSPIEEGRVTGLCDTRLAHYAQNCRSVPSLTGAVVPENASSRREYERELLGRVYRDLAPLDPEGVLRYEWVNARGAIARFDRSAIEIRVVDGQEHPRADIALAALIAGVLAQLAAERWSSSGEQRAPQTARLAAILQATARDAERAAIDDAGYLDLLGARDAGVRTAGDLWRHLSAAVWPAGSPERERWGDCVTTILERGCLARRILAAAGPSPAAGRLREVYAELCDCLVEGRAFGA